MSMTAVGANPRASGPVFTVERVGVTFETPSGPRTVLDGLDITVVPGETLTIVGGSGTGKSTLLRLFGGLALPTEGVVRHHGHPISSAPKGVVMVFQDYTNSLLPWRTVNRNIELGIQDPGQDKAARAETVARMRSLVSLDHAADQYPWQLSGGMQQRVQIARALATAPEVLLMDEPFGALDAITRATLQDELARIQQLSGATTIFITHDVEEAIYLGDRVLVLGGRPARVTAEFVVDIPRPRDQIETRESDEFVALRHKVHEALDAAMA